MKYFTLLILLFPFNSYACNNWISESEFQRSQEGLPAKAGCKKEKKCFCYDNIDLRDSKIGFYNVDDRSKPIYEYAEIENIEIENKAGELVELEICPDKFYMGLNGCEKLLGYEQREVEGLIISEEKRSQRIEFEKQERASQKAKNQHAKRIQERREWLDKQLMHEESGDWSSDKDYQERVLEVLGRGKSGNREK